MMRFVFALTLVAGLAMVQSEPQVLLNFTGTLVRATKNKVVIQPDNDNEMSFVRTKKTKFESGGKEVDSSKIEHGTPVRVEAYQKLNGELEATSVSVVAVDQSPNK